MASLCRFGMIASSTCKINCIRTLAGMTSAVACVDSVPWHVMSGIV